MEMHRSRTRVLTTPYLLHIAWVLTDLPEIELAFLQQHGKTKSGKRGEVLVALELTN